MNRRYFLAALPLAFVGGCGFQLRRVDGVPFASVYIDGGGGTVAERVRTLLRADKKTRLVATPQEAEAVIKVAPEVRTKTILSLSGAGRVTEYRLGLSLSYSVTGGNDQVLAAPEVIELTRDLTYDDTQLLAKGAEEQLLYRDMEENAALRILRRLQSLAP
jgi:LPS-assembly lipoprotein